ncbi:amidase family protein [Halobellus marinus]|uniref:amidase family protein n=1 Tax=Halobellus TaxID=1073986 RepID=UPI0028AC6C6B|nr:amidase family protein [Halobellus sp. DFY28]
MDLSPPTTGELRSAAERFDFSLTDDALPGFERRIGEQLACFDVLGKYDEPGGTLEPTAWSRDETDRWDDEDPLNAWITRTTVTGTESGPLDGLSVAVKDNIAVAGVPLTCGTRTLADYTPAVDATVVSRLLDAGATIAGKTNMDELAFSGLGDTSEYGPTRNPADPTRLAGGSSGGSAIAVATGEADVALGTDQGGSVRAPAAWTGVVGHKPTHGLVPYSGCVGLEPALDHVGALASDVETVARVLDVLAGSDDVDPRQPTPLPVDAYLPRVRDPMDDLRVAAIEEGFSQPTGSTDVNEAVEERLRALRSGGATVDNVSVPMHADGMDIYSASFACSLAIAMRGGWDTERAGRESIDPVERAVLERVGGALPNTVKQTALLGEYVLERAPEAYAEAMQLRQRLERQYEAVLAEYDVLAMPTTPRQAVGYDSETGRATVAEEYTPLTNTAPFDATGHPSLSVPVGHRGDLPVGLMLTGAHFEDATVLHAGRCIERARP